MVNAPPVTSRLSRFRLASNWITHASFSSRKFHIEKFTTSFTSLFTFDSCNIGTAYTLFVFSCEEDYYWRIFFFIYYGRLCGRIYVYFFFVFFFEWIRYIRKIQFYTTVNVDRSHRILSWNPSFLRSPFFSHRSFRHDAQWISPTHLPNWEKVRINERFYCSPPGFVALQQQHGQPILVLYGLTNDRPLTDRWLTIYWPLTDDERIVSSKLRF